MTINAPNSCLWYEASTSNLLKISPESNAIEIDLTLNNFGLLIKEGSIIPTYNFDHQIAKYIRSTEDLKDCKLDINVYLR